MQVRWNKTICSNYFDFLYYSITKKLFKPKMTAFRFKKQ